MQMYGGLLTITSHFSSSSGGESASCSWKSTVAPRRCAFSSAMLSASRLISHAVTLACGMLRASVMAIHPLPVPMSSTFACFGLCRSTIWHSSSVSGRGMSTPGLTQKVRSAKTALPVTYCTGAPSSSCRISCSNRPCSSGFRLSSAPPQMSVKVMPKTSKSRRRTMLRASCSSYWGSLLASSVMFIGSILWGYRGGWARVSGEGLAAPPAGKPQGTRGHLFRQFYCCISLLA